MRIDITWLAGATALFALPLAPQEPRAFEDPRPPEVNELEAVEAPEPATYPELRFHRAPKPLAEGAVTEDWPTFLGPRRDARRSPPSDDSAAVGHSISQSPGAASPDRRLSRRSVAAPRRSAPSATEAVFTEDFSTLLDHIARRRWRRDA